MKRVLSLLFILLLLGACSVQEKVSPMIFMERIIKSDSNINADIDNAFYEKNNYICYAKYADKTDVVFETEADEHGNATKISLACIQTDKVDDFVNCSVNIVKTYAPDDSAQDVINNLFADRKFSDKCLYHETQWYLYSAVISEKGLFFSVENKKLNPTSKVEFSLKQNDIVEY